MNIYITGSFSYVQACSPLPWKTSSLFLWPSLAAFWWRHPVTISKKQQKNKVLSLILHIILLRVISLPAFITRLCWQPPPLRQPIPHFLPCKTDFFTLTHACFLANNKITKERYCRPWVGYIEVNGVCPVKFRCFAELIATHFNSLDSSDWFPDPTGPARIIICWSLPLSPFDSPGLFCPCLPPAEEA